MKTPPYWYRKDNERQGLQEVLLSPVAPIYTAISNIHRSFKKTYKSKLPVICVGNITAGGSGKTPAAIALMQYVKANKIARKPFFLTRGYGGKLNGTLVDSRIDSVKDVGDEALLLAKYAPTIVASDREEGAKIAEAMFADLIIMDDGMQNPGLHKDLVFMVVDGKKGFGNGKMIPAGPLRQPINNGIEAADIFIIINDDERGVSAYLPKNKPQLSGKIISTKKLDKKAKYLAFAGLAHPDKFYNTAKKKGLILEEQKSFPDHYVYSKSDIRKLFKKAEKEDLKLLTTEKDIVRIPAEYHEKIETLPVELHIQPYEIVLDALAHLIEGYRNVE